MLKARYLPSAKSFIYTIDGLNWEIDGSFMAHDYQITHSGNPIISIRKEWMTWGDSYELNISDPRDEILALSVVLTIDCVMAAAAAATSFIIRST